MHWSVNRTFEVFLEKYFPGNPKISILEVGSMNINGELRALKTSNMEWLGLDLELGPGVDQVIELGKRFPLDGRSFDLVVASSVFEHDIQFWNTFLEIIRSVNNTGIILLIVPSQGAYHRHPLDAFRFYPDAGIALSKWAEFSGLPIKLIESFTTKPENDMWADFVAIFTPNLNHSQSNYLGGSLNGENWIVENELISATFQEQPYELRRIKELEDRNIELSRRLLESKRGLGQVLIATVRNVTRPLRRWLAKRPLK